MGFLIRPKYNFPINSLRPESISYYKILNPSQFSFSKQITYQKKPW